MVVEWYLSRKYPIHEDNILIAFEVKIFISLPAMIAFEVISPSAGTWTRSKKLQVRYQKEYRIL